MATAKAAPHFNVLGVKIDPMKHFLIFALTLHLFLQIAECNQYGQLSYSISNNRVTILDCSSDAEGTIVVPEEIEGVDVTEIEDYAFFDCTKITQVALPQAITNIGEGCFSHCTSLESITVDSGNTVYSSESRDELSGIRIKSSWPSKS